MVWLHTSHYLCGKHNMPSVKWLFRSKSHILGGVNINQCNITIHHYTKNVLIFLQTRLKSLGNSALDKIGKLGTQQTQHSAHSANSALSEFGTRRIRQSANSPACKFGTRRTRHSKLDILSDLKLGQVGNQQNSELSKNSTLGKLGIWQTQQSSPSTNLALGKIGKLSNSALMNAAPVIQVLTHHAMHVFRHIPPRVTLLASQQRPLSVKQTVRQYVKLKLYAHLLLSLH